MSFMTMGLLLPIYKFSRHHFKRERKGSEPTRKIRRVPATTAKMDLPRTSAMAHAAAGGSPVPNSAPSPEPAPVYVSAMDTYVPIIPDPNPENIKRCFKHPTLTKIEDEPNYEQMFTVREELFRNAIAINSKSGGKKHGLLGSVHKPSVYQTEAGQAWTIPTSRGMYPTFSSRANYAENKREVTEFINLKTPIKISELVEELLKN